MLKSRHVILALALLLAMLGDSWGGSHRPPPRHGKLKSQIQTHGPVQRGTEQSPLIVKIAPGPNADEQAAQVQRDRDTKAAADRRSEYITVSIAIISAIQAIALIVTVFAMMGIGRRQLRAYISIEQAARTGPDQPAPQFQLVFKNWGQTPTYGGRYWAEVRVCECASAADITPSGKKFDGRFALLPANSFALGQINRDNAVAISGDQIAAFNDGKIAFYIFGQLDFLDAFRKRRWLNFKFRYGKESVANSQCAVEEIQYN
jgi:hypothetical protein